MAIAHIFGASAETDAYLTALIIPGVFITVAGVITVAFVPVFTEYRIKQGEEDAWRIASALISAFVGVFVLGGGFALLAAPTIVRLLAPGFGEQTRESAVHLLRVMSPAITFWGLSGLSAAILNSYRNFIVPALDGLLYNVGIISGTLFLSTPYGITGPAIGMVAGSLCYLLVQSIIIAKKKNYYKLSFNLAHPGVKKILWLVLPILVGSATEQLNLIVDRILASGLVEGSIAALAFGVRVTQLPLGVLAVAIGVAVYPTLSQQVSKGRLDQLSNTFSESIRMLWFGVIPATAGLIVLREPVIRLLFERGAFDPIASSMTATALLYYSLGSFACAGNVLLTRTYFAMQDIRTPVRLSALVIGLNLVLNLILIRWLGHGGLALASSIAAIAHFLMLAYLLQKKLRHIDWERIIKSACKIIFASSVMGVVCWFGMNLSERFFADVASLPRQLLQVGGLVLLGALTYLMMAILLRMEELHGIARLRHLFRQSDFHAED